MASVTTTTTAASRQTPSRPLRKPVSTASTPNLNSSYQSQSYSRPSTTRARALSRKSSLATLTASTLASIPDVTSTYPFDAAALINMPPGTPGRATADEVVVGDLIDVPGGMLGTVRFVGAVQGKKGLFAGVELDSDFANRGKNNGDVDGISYFSTSVPNAGIFLPISKAVRHESSFGASRGYPMTPVAGSSGGLRAGNQNSTNFTPPTPAMPKFSASVGPGARAPSPAGKRTRPSLPRPESPVRRMQMTPGPRPSIGTPVKPPSRYGSPTTNRFAQSVRGPPGDPNKKVSKLDRMPSLGPRSASALGSASGLDDDATPQQSKKNGSIGSISSFSSKVRPHSRAANAANDEEMERLRTQLEDRDRQLREQAATLADMEGSLTELQTLIEGPGASGMGGFGGDDHDSHQLRQMLREKNEKIAMLTAEFDAHRADFRSTIDTLEMASTETERVYEKRIEELMADIRELESRNLDVDTVASQLKQLEELVQELEEGLEDARRGEAEARGEVEFLRGEVERTRTELRREREKPAAAPPASNGGSASTKELEQKEDEIRGLKAIIHSLSRDSIPGTPNRRMSALMLNGEAVENKIARDNLERQVAELQSILDKKETREGELEKEIVTLRRSSQQSSVPNNRSSLRDSRDTVVLARAMEGRAAEGKTHKRANTLDTMLESDNYSNATENSTLWCEICETGGHDILTCTNVFGPDGTKTQAAAKPQGDAQSNEPVQRDHVQLSPPLDNAHPAPLSPVRSRTPQPPTPSTVKVMPNPMESGPVAGKESGIMDPEKWCAVCERDGHDSVDCPFEDAF